MDNGYLKNAKQLHEGMRALVTLGLANRLADRLQQQLPPDTNRRTRRAHGDRGHSHGLGRMDLPK
jgi:hypothetical protein